MIKPLRGWPLIGPVLKWFDEGLKADYPVCYEWDRKVKEVLDEAERPGGRVVASYSKLFSGLMVLHKGDTAVRMYPSSSLGLDYTKRGDSLRLPTKRTLKRLKKLKDGINK